MPRPRATRATAPRVGQSEKCNLARLYAVWGRQVLAVANTCPWCSAQGREADGPHTEWTFTSDTVDSDSFEPFSVLNLDYRLESDLHGDIKANGTQKIALKPVSMGGGTVPGKVTRVKLDVSYDDGATWQKVTLAKGADGYWTGSFRTAKKPGGFLSVRASAETNTGFGVENEIIRAYGLR